MNENTRPETHPDQRHKCRNTTTKPYHAHSPLPRVLRNRKPRDRVPQRGHDELRGHCPALVALRDRGADVDGVDGVHREPHLAGSAGGVQLHGQDRGRGYGRGGPGALLGILLRDH